MNLEELLKYVTTFKEISNHGIWVSGLLWLINKSPDILSKWLDVKLKHLEVLEKSKKFENEYPD